MKPEVNFFFLKTIKIKEEQPGYQKEKNRNRKKKNQKKESIATKKGHEGPKKVKPS